MSVIIPVYNVEKYLPQCLDSVLAQTYSNIEVICVNDGSTDNCLSLLKDYCKSDNRVKLIEIENAGVSNARNVALEEASGVWVIFVDSDDWIDLNCVEVLLGFAETNHCEIVMFPYISERGMISLKRELYLKQKLFTGEDCQRLARRIIGPIGSEITSPAMLDSYGTVWGKLYSRHCIENQKFVDLSQIGSAEDSLFNMAVFKRVSVIGYVPETYYHYRCDNNSSLTTRGDPLLSDKRKRMFSIISERFGDQEERIALNNRIALSVLGLMINEYSFANSRKRMDSVLSDPIYKEPLKLLETKYMPVHWRFFFYCARNQWSRCMKAMIWLIQFVRK